MAALVLVVDDDEGIRDAMRSLFEDEGHVVVTAPDGKEALEMLANGFRPTVIFLDLLMPGMDGWAFRKAQRRLPHAADVPVVVMSASGLRAAAVLRQTAAAHYLPKPLSADMMLGTVSRYAAQDA